MNYRTNGGPFLLYDIQYCLSMLYSKQKCKVIGGSDYVKLG